MNERTRTIVIAVVIAVVVVLALLWYRDQPANTNPGDQDRENPCQLEGRDC